MSFVPQASEMCKKCERHKKDTKNNRPRLQDRWAEPERQVKSTIAHNLSDSGVPISPLSTWMGRSMVLCYLESR